MSKDCNKNPNLFGKHPRQKENKKKYEGMILKSKNFGDFKIVNYVSSTYVEIEFILSKFKHHGTLRNLLKGEVKDFTQPTLFGVGIVDKQDIDKKVYKIWQSMLERCYSKKYKSKYPTYENCIASEYFKYYSHFEKWCYQQVGFDNEGWHLDKDLLIKGNKVYSEDTCVFLPKEINLIFGKKTKTRSYKTGVRFDKRYGKYSVRIHTHKGRVCFGGYTTESEAYNKYVEEKERHIKFMANQFKGLIDNRAYYTLMNYKVDNTYSYVS